MKLIVHLIFGLSICITNSPLLCAQQCDTILFGEKASITGMRVGGQSVGIWTMRNNENRKLREFEFSSGSHSIIRDYWPNEQVREEYVGRITQMPANIIKDGFSNWYSVNGDLLTKAKYKDGHLHGQFVRFDKMTGLKIQQGKFRNGRYVGFWRNFHPNGNLESKGRYALIEDDSGKELLFHSNDEFGSEYIAETKTRTLNKVGKWKYYDEEGHHLRTELHEK